MIPPTDDKPAEEEIPKETEGEILEMTQWVFIYVLYVSLLCINSRYVPTFCIRYNLVYTL